MVSKAEKLNWTIAVVGLLASLISIYAFVTGTSTLAPRPKPNPIVVQQTPAVQTPPTPPNKQDTLGDKATAPIKNGVNWIGSRLKIRH